MSKKHKIKKKISSSVPERSSEIQAASVPVTRRSDASSPALILFNRRTNIFLLVLLALYILLSALKIHTSNIGNWDTFFGLPESESVIAGKPRFIRMDEWMIGTPTLLSQYEMGFPLKNEANGGGNAAVVCGLPIKDISSVLRPAHWSFFVFDLETAFALYWNFNIFFFVISMFLLFMLLTRNNFWLSAAGAVLVFLAPAVQWWSYCISTEMMYLNGMVIGFFYLLYARKPWMTALASVVLMICIFSFLSNLYPPFQVPLVYLYLAIAIGYFIREKKFAKIKERWVMKLSIAAAAIIVLGFFLYHYREIAKDTFAIMLNTVYPGRRFSTGGDLIEGKIFADFFSMFMSDRHTPKKWENICEVSGAILFFPMVFYVLIFYYFKFKRTDPLLNSLSVFIVGALIYVLAGFPAFLSKITLFSMSPAFRTLPLIGIGNYILLVCYLGSNKIEVKNSKFRWIEFGILAVTTFLLIRIISSYVNKVTDNYFTNSEVNIVSMLVVLSYLLIRYKDFRFVKPALGLVLGIMVISQLGVNPLTKGLAPILDNPLRHATDEIHKKDPGAGWAFFGDARLTHLIKSTGSNIMNGVKYVPPMEMMKTLDPQGINDSIYNRYAWVSMKKLVLPGIDTVVFRKTNQDSYMIFMDPCSPRLKQLKVKYFVFDYQPEVDEIRCMSHVKDTIRYHIYKRDDQ
jgi:hypothetical protein